MPVKHLKVSALPDSGQPGLVEPSDWNDAHDLSGLVAADIIDFDTAVYALVGPAGPDTAVQVNNGGVFGGTEKLLWNDASVRLTIGEPANTAYLRAAPGTVVQPIGGTLAFFGGDGYDDGLGTPSDGGAFTQYGGSAVGTGTAGVSVVEGGYSPDGTAGDAYLTGGFADTGQAGNVVITRGDTDSGTRGQVLIPDLPVSDPGVSGALWNDGGTLKISA